MTSRWPASGTESRNMMDSKQCLQELGWNRGARLTRARLAAQVAEQLGEIAFLTRAETIAFAEAFGEATRRCESATDAEPEGVLAELASALRGKQVIWLHRDTHDAGAMRVDAERLIAAPRDLRREHGPDLFFATPGVEIGFSLDVDEYDETLVWWKDDADV